jgi:hypothetical protein
MAMQVIKTAVVNPEVKTNEEHNFDNDENFLHFLLVEPSFMLQHFLKAYIMIRRLLCY